MRILLVWILMLTPSSSVLPAPAQEPINDSGKTALRQTIKQLLDAGRVSEAQDQVKAEVAVRGETAETLFLQAQILFRQKQFKDSMQRVQYSLTLEQRDPEAHKLLAFNAVALNRMDIVEPALKAALQLAPNDFVIHFHLGLLYYTTSRFSMAESEFQTVTKLNPAYMKAYDLLGLAQEELQSDEVVIETYRRAIGLTERQKLSDEAAYLHLAKFLWLRNRYSESLPLARRAVELKPKSAEAYYVLGRVLDKLGQEAEAVKMLQHSTQIDLQYAESHYLLSRIYLRQGREEQARQEMETLEKINRNRATNEGR
jgi:tetratricopeptide (TPR) repeat protein